MSYPDAITHMTLTIGALVVLPFVPLLLCVCADAYLTWRGK